VTRITTILLSLLLVAPLGCGDERATGMGPDKPLLGPEQGVGPDDDGPAGDENDDTVLESIGDDAVTACDDVSCGPASECRVLLSASGAPAPVCVPHACDASPPETVQCPQTCETGYAVVDGASTCGCCSLADEPEFRTCFDDKDCSASELCDHAFCENTCAPGLSCAAVCAGRCHAAALVPTL
jgi:hypothetical protein